MFTFHVLGGADIRAVIDKSRPEIVARVRETYLCLTAGTSPHLAERKLGHRRFIDGIIAQLLRGELVLRRDKPRIFSPFGLGVLDLAVGLEIFTIGVGSGRALEVPNFFAEVERW